jgi:hypothetical protein
VFLLIYLDAAFAAVAWYLLDRGFWPLALPFLGVSSAVRSVLLLAGAFALVDPWQLYPRTTGPGMSISP